ncbi:hypothetical protein C8Q78DRAFT_1081607 [Trametes maxima]|nr:hypothetical protein C8Q78DRAFT_1081607 [Trametes maxima]
MASARLSVFAVLVLSFTVTIVQAAPLSAVSAGDGTRVDSSFLSTQKSRRETDNGDDSDVHRIDLVFLSKQNEPRDDAPVENVFLS